MDGYGNFHERTTKWTDKSPPVELIVNTEIHGKKFDRTKKNSVMYVHMDGDGNIHEHKFVRLYLMYVNMNGDGNVRENVLFIFFYFLVTNSRDLIKVLQIKL